MMERIDEVALTAKQALAISNAFKASSQETLGAIAKSCPIAIPRFRLVVSTGDASYEIEYSLGKLPKRAIDSAESLISSSPVEGLLLSDPAGSWESCYAMGKLFPTKVSPEERALAKAGNRAKLKEQAESKAELARFFYALQWHMSHLPEAWSEPTESKVAKKPKNPKKKAKVILITRRSLRAEPAGRVNVYTCPCWTVRGHWRKLPSGKTIWVPPHKKGKHRSDPEALEPKSYEAGMNI